MTKKIGILTGGGDAGGLNAAIEAATKSAIREGWEVYGIRRGWEGLIFNDTFLLNVSGVDGIHSATGTKLQTSRTNPFNYTGVINGKNLERNDVSKLVIENAKRAGLEAIIACGGDDTLGVIPKLIATYGSNMPIFVGIPKTMDGDLQTYSLGLDTAINRAKQVIEDFVPVLTANGNIGIVELFGRDVGRVAFKAGIAAGADVILIPEIPVDLGCTCNFIADRYDERARNNNGVSYVLIAVAEGTQLPLSNQQMYQGDGKDSFGHSRLGGIGEELKKLLNGLLKDDPRITAHTKKLDIKTLRPAYDVRGGATSYSDSYIGQKLGLAAVLYLKNGAVSGMGVVNFNEHGQIELMPIEELTKPRPVHDKVLQLFEMSGLYCFGRRPGGDYKPTAIVSNIKQ